MNFWRHSCLLTCLFLSILSVKSPLFMLFLDCVWQMMNQYPAAFEFTEAYLTVLSDSMWIPLFSTFLFNSSKQRAQYFMVRDTCILYFFCYLIVSFVQLVTSESVISKKETPAPISTPSSSTKVSDWPHRQSRNLQGESLVVRQDT